MAKTINTRMSQKHDIEANWLKATNFVPLMGEIIVYDPDENHTTARFKIGDGQTNVNDLSFGYMEDKTLGFYIYSVDVSQLTIVLSLTRAYDEEGNPQERVWNEEAAKTLSAWSQNDLLNYDVGTTYTMRSKFNLFWGGTEGQDGIIEVDYLPFDQTTIDAKLKSELDGTSMTIYNVNKPKAGAVLAGQYTFAQGVGSIAAGHTSVALNRDTKAFGNYSFAQGRGTTAGYGAMATGFNNSALGNFSHTEGTSTYVDSLAANGHAEGHGAKVYGEDGHAEGESTEVRGNWGHAEGLSSVAHTKIAHAEGEATHAYGIAAHTEGKETQAGTENVGATAAHAEGYRTKVYGTFAHSEGEETEAHGIASHTEGNKTIAQGNFSHTEGNETQTAGSYTLTNADNPTTFYGESAHAEGKFSKAYGNESHAEGTSTTAVGRGSHSEGHTTVAEGDFSHVEGNGSKALGAEAHAEGVNTIAHRRAHAEGLNTVAQAYSHAEGVGTYAEGQAAHAEGQGTYATMAAQHVQGKFNEVVTTTDSNGNTKYNAGNYAHVVGWGTESAPKNIHTLGTTGDAWFAGNVTIGPNNDILATEAFVEDSLPKIDQDLNYNSFNPIANAIVAVKFADVEDQYKNLLDGIDKANYATTKYVDDSIAGIDIPEQVVKQGSVENSAITNSNQATARFSFAQGKNTKAYGEASHAEGMDLIDEDNVYYVLEASGMAAHAEGQGTRAQGTGSHAEGFNTLATANRCHAEGGNSKAHAEYSHAEGIGATAGIEGESYIWHENYIENAGLRARAAHAEGVHTHANARGAHAEGFHTIADKQYQHVQGKYNVTGDYAHIIGNGDSEENRSNAYTLDWYGNAWFAGNITLGIDNKLVATEEYVNNAISNLDIDGSDPEAVKFIAQSLTDSQKKQARENIGAGTSNFSGSYNDLTDKPTIPNGLTVDTELDANSTNAIANSAVAVALDGKLDKPVVQVTHLSEATGTAAATFTVTNLSKDITVITDGPAYAYYSFTLTSNTGESATIFPTNGALWQASEATTLTFNIQSIANETGIYIPSGDSYTFSIEDDGTPSDTTVIYTYGESSSDPIPMTWEEMHEMKANKIRGNIEITYNEDGYFQIPEAAVTNGIKIKTDPSVPDSESLYVLNVYEKVYQDTWTYQQCNELTFDSGVFIVPWGGEEVVLDNFVGSSYWSTNYYYQWSRAYYNSITMSVDGAKDLPEVYDELTALKAKVAELESTINTLMNGEW